VTPLTPNQADQEIAALRREVDRLDDSLLPLLEARARVAIELGRVKRAAGRPLRDAPREEEIVDRLARSLSTLAREDLVGVYRALMAMCLEIQSREVGDDGDC
jgi:chorismate mutase / prephenate dehydratase